MIALFRLRGCLSLNMDTMSTLYATGLHTLRYLLTHQASQSLISSWFLFTSFDTTVKTPHAARRDSPSLVFSPSLIQSLKNKHTKDRLRAWSEKISAIFGNAELLPLSLRQFLQISYQERQREMARWRLGNLFRVSGIRCQLQPDGISGQISKYLLLSVIPACLLLLPVRN